MENVRNLVFTSFEGHLGEETCEAFVNSLVKAPADTTLRINKNVSNVDSLIKELTSMIGSQFLVTVHSSFDDVLVIKSLEQKKLPDTGSNFILVDKSCGESVLRGADPGVFACSKSLKVGSKVRIYAAVENIPTLGSKLVSPDGILVGVGILEIPTDEIFKTRSGVAVKIVLIEHPKPSLNNILTGKIYPQNIPSIIVGHELNVDNLGSTSCILDMCAAPGGKTLHAASRTRNDVPIIAVERSKTRFEVLKTNLEIHECTRTQCINMDTTKHSVEALLEMFSSKVGRTIAGFDRILLDPPCSGFGKRPDLRPEFPKAEYFLLQRKLLLTAWKLLLPNGVLIYSTCSVLPQENEKVLEYFFSKNCDAVIEPLKNSEYGIPAIAFGDNKELENCRRFLPPQSDTVGFFIAKLRKLPTRETSN